MRRNNTAAKIFNGLFLEKLNLPKFSRVSLNVQWLFNDKTAIIHLIRKIVQPSPIFSIIRRILTQTNPSKRNCHG
ncbi:hypothetical protein, partial [Nitrosomonas oligotropha]|uniref:hypothetical protein n=1 Tax=Nitrosomonas oligotropha TaxID=42354 RepID=UPI001C624C2F